MDQFKKAGWIVCLVIVLLDANHANSQTMAEPLIPQNLLKLIHTPQVQKELGLEDDPRLMDLLKQIDQVWWPSRILPEAKQLETTRDLEKKLLEALSKIVSPEMLRRLKQIDIQSQGTRALLRADVAESIQLDNNQLQTIRTAFLATDELTRQLNAKPGGDKSLEEKLRTAREKEQQSLNGLLSSSQRNELGKLVGQTFTFHNLKRIYPLAPELVDSGAWAGKGRTSLKAEKGKVVLVHFYAFQCHNCVANFKHYTRWHSTLADKGVSVIGIQTPETSAERDIQRVQQAAKEQGFEFPVLIDLKNSNCDAWGNTMWPTVYVIDRNGYIRQWWQGELNWQGATGDKTIETLVDELLLE